MSRYDYEFDIASDSVAGRVIRLVGHDQRVLELGCSTGHMSRVLHERGCAVTGLEMDASAAEKAREWCDDVKVCNLDEDVWATELASAPLFDVVLAADVLEHLRDPQRCLAHARRLLKPGGRIVLSTPNIAHGGVIAGLLQSQFSYRSTGLLDRTHIHFFTRESLTDVLNAEGFAVEHVCPVEAGAEHPEFAAHWNSLSLDARNTIERSPDYRVFQWVLSATKLPTDAASVVMTEAQRQIDSLRNQSHRMACDLLALRLTDREREQTLVAATTARHAAEIELMEVQRRLKCSQEANEEQVKVISELRALVCRQNATLNMARMAPFRWLATLGRLAAALPLLILAAARNLAAALKHVLATTFRSLPLHQRSRLKETLFELFPWLFRNRAAYKNWAASRANALGEPTDDPATAAHRPTPPEAARSLEIDHSLAIPLSFVTVDRATPRRVASVIHMYYAELASEFRLYLNNIPGSLDLYISTPDESSRAMIERVFEGWPKGTVDVRVAPNRGRDVAPKLVTFREVYPRYDFILFLHSKQSKHADILSGWRHFLFESLIGSPAIVESIYWMFERDPKLGMVASQHFEPMRHWLNWGGNLPAASRLATRMGFVLDERAPLDFPSGSMLWLRSHAIQPLLDLDLDYADFEPEQGQVDATIAHAIERLLFHVCETAGFRWLKVARPELFDHTPMICPVGHEAEFDAFIEKYAFQVLKPSGIAPRKAMPTPIAHPPAGLADAVRARCLGETATPHIPFRIAVGIVTHNNDARELRQAVDAANASLAASGASASRLYVLDNGEPSAPQIGDLPDISYLETQGNIGFGAGHNRIMAEAFLHGADLYIAINPDGMLHPDAIRHLLRMSAAYEGNALIEAIQFPVEHPKHYDPINLDTPWVSGACLAIPSKAYHSLGGFDESFFMYCEDVDLSWRARAHGFATKACPAALFLHAVTNRSMSPETLKMIYSSGVTLARKWQSPAFENQIADELRALGALPPGRYPTPVPSSWLRYADFSHGFSFAPTRW